MHHIIIIFVDWMMLGLQIGVAVHLAESQSVCMEYLGLSVVPRWQLVLY